MKNISVWAHKNFILSRVIIFIGYLFLFLLSFFTGNALKEKNISIPNNILFYSTLLFVLIASLYILQKYFLHQKFSYLYHKTLDGFLLITTYLIILTIYNQHGSISNMIMQQSKPAFGSFVKTEKSVPQLIIKKDRTELKTIKKEKRQFIKNIINWYKSKSSGNKTLLIILSVIAALALLTLLAALSCTIACSGSGAVAILVALLGTFGIVYGLIKLIERINNGPKKPKTSS